MPRDFETVVGQVLDVVPVEEHVLRDRLQRLARDSRYLAPEVMQTAWRNVAELFFARFGETPPTEGWGAKAVAILKGEGS
jgi:hypothetical protein